MKQKVQSSSCFFQLQLPLPLFLFGLEFFANSGFLNEVFQHHPLQVEFHLVFILVWRLLTPCVFFAGLISSLLCIQWTITAAVSAKLGYDECFTREAASFECAYIRAGVHPSSFVLLTGVYPLLLALVAKVHELHLLVSCVVVFGCSVFQLLYVNHVHEVVIVDGVTSSVTNRVIPYVALYLCLHGFSSYGAGMQGLLHRRLLCSSAQLRWRLNETKEAIAQQRRAERNAQIERSCRQEAELYVCLQM